jgi:hypothetical protein
MRLIVVIVVISRLAISKHSGDPWPLVRMPGIGIPALDQRVQEAYRQSTYVSKKMPRPVK